MLSIFQNPTPNRSTELVLVDDDQITQFLQYGLQQTITLLCLVQLAALNSSQKTPAGITKRFDYSFHKPVLGKLLEFAVWLSQYQEHTGVDEIANYLQKNEKNKPGWLGKCISLRNQFHHPGHASQEEILETLRELLKTTPPFDAFGDFIVSDHGELLWQNSNEHLILSPFITILDEQVSYLAEITDQLQPLNQSGQSHQETSITKWIATTRISDCLLHDATIDEMVLKIQQKKLTLQTENSITQGKQSNEFNSLAVLAGPDSLDDLTRIHLSHPQERLALSFSLNQGQKPLLEISKFIGIEGEVSFKELIEISIKRPLLIGIDASSLDSRSFLKLLFWVYDLSTFSPSKKLTVGIGRNIKQLQSEESLFWEELPTDFMGLLHANKATRNKGILAFYWEPRAKVVGWQDRLKGLFD